MPIYDRPTPDLLLVDVISLYQLFQLIISCATSYIEGVSYLAGGPWFVVGEDCECVISGYLFCVLPALRSLPVGRHIRVFVRVADSGSPIPSKVTDTFITNSFKGIGREAGFLGACESVRVLEHPNVASR